MPHLNVEYSDNLMPHDVFLQLNRALVASGQFEEPDIKSRLLKMDDFLIGTTAQNRAFVHVKLAILAGRSTEIKRELSKNLLAVLQNTCIWPTDLSVQLCVEIQDIERESYAKTTI
jgi:5-carboxymethyl-2-hydroxymuconate isomerase